MSVWKKCAALLMVAVGAPFYLIGYVSGSVAGAVRSGFRGPWKSWGDL